MCNDECISMLEVLFDMYPLNKWYWVDVLCVSRSQVMSPKCRWIQKEKKYACISNDYRCEWMRIITNPSTEIWFCHLPQNFIHKPHRFGGIVSFFALNIVWLDHFLSSFAITNLPFPLPLGPLPPSLPSVWPRPLSSSPFPIHQLTITHNWDVIWCII